jgi:hypothetical protein
MTIHLLQRLAKGGAFRLTSSYVKVPLTLVTSSLICDLHLDKKNRGQTFILLKNFIYAIQFLKWFK